MHYHTHIVQGIFNGTQIIQFESHCLRVNILKKMVSPVPLVHNNPLSGYFFNIVCFIGVHSVAIILKTTQWF